MTEEIAKTEQANMQTFSDLKAEVTYWERMIGQCRDMIPSHIRNGYQAMLVVGHGRTLDLDPLTSLQEIGVIKGKVVISARLQMALVRKKCPRARINIKQCDAEAAVIEVQRYPTDDVTTVSFSIQDAKTAGLAGNNWQKYPADMLWARAVSRMCRRVFPDVTLGDYAPEDIESEAQDFDDDKPVVEVL